MIGLVVLWLCLAPPNWWLLSARLYVFAQLSRTGGCSLLGSATLVVIVSSSRPSDPRSALSLGWCAQVIWSGTTGCRAQLVCVCQNEGWFKTHRIGCRVWLDGFDFFIP
ncbi:hypothetical protein U1Q18_016799 [Sarracenia purpurea var. burkii]